ncbi:MAG: hypothetical protein F4Z15_09910, partial [Gammaproteobacteria bacterium]|nr:hypothetical protein [Gammaproteobacteria bacterium]
MLAWVDGLPILLRYQTEWIRESAEVAVMEKSRRIGLSWGDAAERVVYASEGRGNVYYISYDLDMTETYIDDCAEWARRYDRAASEIIEEVEIVDEREVKKFRIDFPGGGSIIALAGKPRKLRSKGRPGDVVIIDEAAFCDDLDELLKAAMAVTQWGGKVRIISTHNGDENPFNQLVVDIRAGKAPYALHRVTLDDAIADGLARRICTVKGDRWSADYAEAWRTAQMAKYRDREAADEELMCVPLQGAGAWLSRVLIESRMHDAPVVRFNGSKEFNGRPEPARRAEMRDWLEENILPLLTALDPLRRHVVGNDFARSGDLSVLAPIKIGETLRRTCPFLLEMKNVPNAQQVQAVKYVCDRLPRFGGGAFDARGNGFGLAETMVDTYGSMIEMVMATESWYREHLPPFKAAFEDDRIRVPRHEDVLDDLRAFRVIRGVPRLPEGKTGRSGERHGDAGMALALAWFASSHAGAEYGYQPAHDRSDSDYRRGSSWLRPDEDDKPVRVNRFTQGGR